MDILVTGGTGSFGQAFVRHLLGGQEYRRIIIYSRSEYLQWQMRQTFKDDRLRFFLGDVRDRDRLQLAMAGVSHVVHAAALKQVDAMEYNPTEAVATNIHGTANVIWAANACGVEKCLALSTDKAVSPANLYGATKATVERFMVAANVYDACRFACTRYGNVWGSRGSVVEYFRRVAMTQDPVKITDPDMTRFLMSLGQAVLFVQSSLAALIGGEVFVPKLPSVSLRDLADALVPSRIHEVIGIRPGEKMHESMVSVDEGRRTADNGSEYVIHPEIELPDGRAGSCLEPVCHAYSSDGNPLRVHGAANVSALIRSLEGVA